MSTGAIQHYFGQLEVMLEPMIARCAGRVVPRLQSAWDGSRPPAERVRGAVRAMLEARCADDDDMRAWQQLTAASSRDPQVRGWMSAHVEQVRADVARGLVDAVEGLGMKLRTTPEQAARAVLAWVEGAALHVRSEPNDFESQCSSLELAARSLIAF
jgi:AcrR family transcriptional regulator